MGKKNQQKKQQPARKPQATQKSQVAQKPQESVFKEAWENMSSDFNRMLPEKMQNKGKKKFVLWLFIVELLVLGVIGKFVYEWWTG